MDVSHDDVNKTSYCEDEDPDPAFSGEASSLDFAGFDEQYFLKIVHPETKSVDFRFANEIGSASYIGCRSFFYFLEIYMFLDVELTHIDPLHNNTVQNDNLYPLHICL